MSEHLSVPLQALAIAGGVVTLVWLGSGLLARAESSQDQTTRGADPLDPW